MLQYSEKRVLPFRIILIAIAAVGLMVGVALADPGDNTQTVALESLGTDRQVRLNGNGITGTSSGVIFTLDQSLTFGNKIHLNWGDGLAFANHAFYSVCAQINGSDAAIAWGTPGNATAYMFNLFEAVEAGNTIWLAPESCDDAPPVRVLSSGAGVGNKTLTVAAYTAGGVTLESPSTAAAINVTQEFTGTVTTRNLVIAYLGDSSADGTLFTADSTNITDTAYNGTALNLTPAALDFDTATDADLAVNAVINFSVDTNWQGVSRLWLSDAGDCEGGTRSTVVVSPSGAQSLTVPVWDGTASSDVAICIEVDGTIPLEARAITGQYDIQVGSGGLDPEEVNVIWQQWTTNGWQGLVPHMRYGSTMRTFVRILNRNSTSGGVFVDVTEPDGTVLERVDLGPIAARASNTYSASEIASLAGTSSPEYEALFTVGADPSKIYATAFFNLNSGGGWTTRDVTLYEIDNTSISSKMK